MAAVASQPFGNRSNGAFVDLSKVKGSTSPKKPKSKKTVEELEQRKKEQFRAILDNYDLECAMRKQQIEARMQDFLVSLRRKCENEILRLPTSLHQMTVKDFNELYSFNIRLALEGIKRQGFEQGKQEAEREREQGAVEATVRKRKRIVNQDAVVPPSPAQPRPKRMATVPSSANKAKSPSASSKAKSPPIKRATRAVSKSARSTPPVRSPNNTNPPSASKANFVYKARPSLKAPPSPALNPALPPTPALGPEGRRRPRRHESIQAFSMNGSPLGIIDVAREDPESDRDGSPIPISRKHFPTGEFTFNMLPEGLAEGLKAELDATTMDEPERKRLERRLVEMFTQSTTSL